MLDSTSRHCLSEIAHTIELIEVGNLDTALDCLNELVVFLATQLTKKEAESAEERRCLVCGGPLIKSKFVDEWYGDNSPVEVVEDWYCPSCKIRWVSFLETKPYKEAEV